jgi:predicted permease
MSLFQDLRFGARMLVKDRSFTLAAITALALGIGVNNTVFTIVNAALIRSLPFDDADRIVSLGTRDDRNRDTGVSIRDFEDWRAASQTMAEMAIFANYTVSLSDDERAAEQQNGGYTSASLFRLLGQKPILGRDFVPEDDLMSSPPTIILGAGIWKSRYGGDPSIIGRAIRANSLMVTVIGVMPEGLKFPFSSELWIPFAHVAPGYRIDRREARNFLAFGRLKDGVPLSQARAELETIGGNLSQQYQDTNKGMVPTVLTYHERFMGGPIRTMFLALMGAVAFVLLIACANVANLLLARSVHRAREMSVRVSLGAGRWRVVRQLLAESVLLSVIAGVVGFALSYAGVRWFDAVTQDVGKPYWLQFTMDPRVFMFFAAVTLATGVIFGLAPALHASKADVSDVLKEGGRSGGGGRRARRWMAALVTVELALTVVLLGGAGFMMRSFLALYQMDLGIDTSNLLTTRLLLPDRKYPTPEVRRNFFQTLDDRLARNPSLGRATVASAFPMGGGLQRELLIDGQPRSVGELPTVTTLSIASSYFETLGVQLRGRAFDDRDGTPGREAAIVNQRLASMHFGTEDPIGRRIQLIAKQASTMPSGVQTETWVTIIGVSPTIRQSTFQGGPPDPVAYLPNRAEPPRQPVLIVRAPGNPGSLTALLREEIRSIDPDMPVYAVLTMDQWLAQIRWPSRVFGTMFAIFAFIALTLAAIGLYGVTAYSVTQRTQEIGVRTALGAQAWQIQWLIARRALVQLAIGLALGLAGAIVVGRLLQSVLVQTSSTDAITLAAIATILVSVAIAACVWPARRATRLDPVLALRYE